MGYRNLQSARQAERQNQRAYDEYEGVLGDENKNIYPSSQHSAYLVRFPLGTDTNGEKVYGQARIVRYDAAQFVIAKAGIPVMVRRDPYDGVETITRMRPDYWTAANIDSRIGNSGEAITKWWDSPNFIRWLDRPSGSVQYPSTLTTTRENPFYWNDFQDWAQFAATPPASQFDMAPYIPAAGYHCLAIKYVDIILANVNVVVSDSQALADALDLTDYYECRANLPHNECVPLTAYDLGDGQTSVDSNSLVEDLRSWIALPQVMGFPNPLPLGKNYFIRDTHQVITYNLTVVGNLTVEGDMVVV